MGHGSCEYLCTGGLPGRRRRADVQTRIFQRFTKFHIGPSPGHSVSDPCVVDNLRTTNITPTWVPFMVRHGRCGVPIPWALQLRKAQAEQSAYSRGKGQRDFVYVQNASHLAFPAMASADAIFFTNHPSRSMGREIARKGTLQAVRTGHHFFLWWFCSGCLFVVYVVYGILGGDG